MPKESDWVITPIPCLQGIRDNYAYVLSNASKTQCVVIDPSESDPVLEVLRQQELTPQALWLTHHHWDHIGGIEDLCERYPGIPVLGSAYDLAQQRIPRQTQGLCEGDVVHFDAAPVRILELPGHTLGAIAYLLGEHLFCGDVMFLAGCGRIFEGSMQQAMQSLGRLRDLPEHTQIWCGHEYTLKNLSFAQTLEPTNDALAERIARVKDQLEKTGCTMPGNIAEERATNPFLRWDMESIRKPDETEEQSFTRVRRLKDAY